MKQHTYKNMCNIVLFVLALLVIYQLHVAAVYADGLRSIPDQCLNIKPMLSPSMKNKQTTLYRVSGRVSNAQKKRGGCNLLKISHRRDKLKVTTSVLVILLYNNQHNSGNDDQNQNQFYWPSM